MKMSLNFCVAILAMGLVIPGQSSATCDHDFDGEELEVECDNGNDTVVVTEKDGNLVLGYSFTISDFENLGSAEYLEDIVIESEGGDDNISIDTVNPSDSVEVKSGPGHDVVFVGGYVTIGNDLKIETNSGDDQLFTGFFLDVGDTVDIKTGSGNDLVLVVPPEGIFANNDIKIDGEGGTYDELIGENNLNAGNKVKIKNFLITYMSKL